MHDEIKQLLRLQDLDIEIRRLEESRRETTGGLEALRAEVERDEKTIGEEKERLQASRVRSKELELQVEDRKGHIEKYQQQLFKVKNNKEYTALLKEIKKLKADISVLEDRLLEFMQETEDEQRRLDEVRAELERVREEYQRRETAARETIERIDREIAAKREEKAKQLRELDQDMYEQYDIIFTRKPDRAVVEVRYDACSGCNMELTAQTLNDLMKDDRVHRCENCGRYIFLPGEEI